MFLIIGNGSHIHAESVIRVGNYTESRSRFAITDNSGGPPYYYSFTSTIYGNLANDNNFSEQGVVPCNVSFDVQVNYVSEGTLVDNQGSLLVDVFFAPAISNNLTDEEADEFAKFINKGGVLYVSGSDWFDSFDPGNGLEFNLLFEKLGVNDRFTEDRYTVPATSKSQTPVKSIITDGPFGVVGSMRYGSFRGFEASMLKSIVASQEIEPIVFEKNIGEGYLIVMGTSLFNNVMISDQDNRKYFLNLFALGCGEQDFGKYDATVLDVPSFKQGLAPYDGDDPYWEDLLYDSGDELDLWCDTNGDNATMAECGCALTSATMAVNYHGFTETPGGFPLNPAFVNLYASDIFPNEKLNQGFSNGNFNWNYLSTLSAVTNKANDTQQKIEHPTRENFSIDRVKELIDEERPVVLKVLGKWGDHWVLVKGYTSDDRLIINDPAYPDPIAGYAYLDERYTPYESQSMIIYKPTNSDYRYLQFITHSDVGLLLTDTLGNKTGYNPETGERITEIPYSDYAFDAYYGDPTSGLEMPAAEVGVNTLTVLLPENGDYELTVYGDSDKEVHIYSSDRDGDLIGKLISIEGAETNYLVHYDESVAGEEIDVSIEVEMDVYPRSRFQVLIPNRWVPVPVAFLSSKSIDPENIDTTSLTFGKMGTEVSQKHCNLRRDFNRDGIKDLLCYFSSIDAGFVNGDREAFSQGKYKMLDFQTKDTVYVYIPRWRR